MDAPWRLIRVFCCHWANLQPVTVIPYLGGLAEEVAASGGGLRWDTSQCLSPSNLNTPQLLGPS